MAREDPALVQIQGLIEGGLTTERGQDGVGALSLDDGREMGNVERLEVGTSGQLRVRHDGGWIRVDEDDLVAEFPERLRSLGPRVVELASLPNDGGSGANEKDLLDIVAGRHARALAQALGG